MFDNVREFYAAELERIREAGLFKHERVIQSPQSAHIRVNGKEVLNFCANNYLGLADNPILKNAARQGIEEYGLGLASVRFICGTQTIHKELEERISKFHGTDDTILYSSCFDANGGIFETLLGEEDAIISDALNHASIIDGIRLCKAKRFRYDHGDLGQLESFLKQARTEGAKKIMIATDGVFSMDGHIAKLDQICALAEAHGAMVMVDECHATGFFGPSGRGATEHCGALGRVDVISSTLGKALGGASGGFVTGRKELISMLRQRSRPYLFSNALPPALVMAGIACIELLSKSDDLRRKLADNTAHFRSNLTRMGFEIKDGTHPIVPVMLGDAKLAAGMADDLLNEGIYVIGFSFPVVPVGQARIRTQLSAAHSKADLDAALTAFQKVGKARGIIR
ncbi:MAG: glycine C-acetyltransferase [Oligoflexia bacterium]|nr:glycine C-acetyltransferase [Oligoflexia bacterium]